MFKNKRLASGFNKQEVVDAFKQKLFDIWCVEPTKKCNKYKHFTMPEDYVPFPCWELWVAIGPPAGEACNLILKVEFIAPASASFVASNGADIEKPPAALMALNANAQSGRFLSRAAMNDVTAKQAVSARSPTSSIHGERLSRDKMNDKIKQLQWLSESEFLTTEEKKAYRRQIHDLMVANVSDSSSPLSSFLASSASSDVESQSVSKQRASENLTEFTSDARTRVLELGKIATDQLDIQVGLSIVPVVVPVVLFPLIENEELSQSNAEPPKCFHGMPFVDYKRWLKITHGLKSNCVVPDGSCLFESAIRCIKELKLSSEGASYAPFPILTALLDSPDWSTVTASSFRKSILTIMKSLLLCNFPALAGVYYNHLEEVILCEGEADGAKGCGIMDHALRDKGEPPQKFETTDDYFKLMAPDSAYGNLSALLAISIFCDIQIHVWIRGHDLPEVYGAETSTHYISFIKEDRTSHYDGLMWCGTCDYDARKRAKVIAAEVEKRDKAFAKERTKQRIADDLAAATKKSNELRFSLLAEQNRAAAASTASTAATAAATASLAAAEVDSTANSASCVTASEAADWTAYVTLEAETTTAKIAALPVTPAAAIVPAAIPTFTGAAAVPLNLLDVTEKSYLKTTTPETTALPVTPAAAIVLAAIPTLTGAAAASQKIFRSMSPMPPDVDADLEKDRKARDRLYSSWHKAKQSFDKLVWDRDIMRSETGTTAGKGIFAKTMIPKGSCIALYWGNLVDGASGLIHVRIPNFKLQLHELILLLVFLQCQCDTTKKLLDTYPNIKRRFSPGHAVILGRNGVNLSIDGSHHCCSTYDSHENRRDLLCRGIDVFNL
jgi:uncharacterized Zn finger protein (UPF0148 family)